MKQRVRIAVIADLHRQSYDPGGAAQRQGYFADVFLLRTVRRLNRFIRPDVTLALGDLVDEPGSAGNEAYLDGLRRILELLESPCIVLPGNHDPAPDLFYRIMPRPPERLDVKGVRFLPFADLQTEGYNARRSAPDIARFAAARRDFDGPIVTVQHVPLFPPGRSDCPYNYTNAPEIIAAMRAHGVNFTISGHYHKGLELEDSGMSFIASPALCEAPFQFLAADMHDGLIDITRHALANPAELGLTDFHVHTPYAYCNENMDVCRSLKLGKLFGLKHMVFTEHSGHLYFDKSDYWSGNFLRGAAPLPHDRVSDCFTDTARLDPSFAAAAMELDCGLDGLPVVHPAHLQSMRLPIGAVHFLPGLPAPQPDPAKLQDEFLGMLNRFLRSGIVSLAHPLRIFQKNRLPPPVAIYPQLVKLLRENQVAAELNFHTNNPAPEFFRMCIAQGVKITFGSDAHNLYEIGEFYPHLRFLREDCGYDGDLSDILLQFTEAARRRVFRSRCNPSRHRKIAHHG